MKIRLACLVLLVAACGDDNVANGPIGTGTSKSATIGTSGGTVTHEGLTVRVPPGAVTGDQMLTITSTTDTPPSNFTSWASPVYRLSPEGLRFSMPIQISIAFTGNPRVPHMFWSKLGASGFDDVGGTVAAGVITGSNNHFSEVFVNDTASGSGGG